MTEHNAEIYKKAFEIAVRCARELNGTPELKEAYQEAQKDNRALQTFMDFCLEKAAEEAPEHTTADIAPVVRCKDCRRCEKAINVHCGKVLKCNMYHPNDGRRYKNPNDFCSYGERREGE